jgi:ribosomal-protein-alanine N-acetyltransferase
MSPTTRPEEVFHDLPTLQTERLLLRRITPGDARDLFACTEDAEGLIQIIIEHYEHHQAAPWGIVRRDTGHLIGTCGFIECHPSHQRAEIAYALAPEHRRRGFMREAVHEVLGFGFGEMGLNRVQARCHVDNQASAAVLRASGMQLEGVLREHVRLQGRFVDLWLFSILARDWAAMG